MNSITLTRHAQEVTVTTEAGELGFILRPDRWNKGYEAWANLQPKDGYARAAVQTFNRLRDAVRFVQTEGVAL